MSKPEPEHHTTVNVTLATPVAALPQKSLGTAVVLWLFLGGFGAHRFYLNRKHGATMLTLWLIGVATSIVGVGLVVLAPLALWVLIDVFSLPRWVREYNAGLTSSLPTPVPVPVPPESTAPLSTQLLREAKRRGGRITVTQGAMATEKTFEEVEACLQGMVSSGYVDVDNDPGSGVVVYVFGELR